MLNNAVGNTGDSINDNIHEQEQFNQEISAGTQQANESVSYTHLDVYKRQKWNNMKLLLSTHT